jgi:hypothetical protein
MGDGRAGKSHLGNEILGQQAFKTSNGGDAMTHGVDIALQGNKLLMDCEGLNNALAPSRAQVLQIGAALASTLIFVLDGKLSEAGLDMLSGVIAQMQMHHKRLPTRLLLVVNKCLLDYGPRALETALESTHGNRGSREAIARAFSQRDFVAQLKCKSLFGSCFLFLSLKPFAPYLNSNLSVFWGCGRAFRNCK